MRFLVVGNPDNRRLTAYAQAVEAAGHEAEALAWSECLKEPGRLSALATGAVVKFDSPGEDVQLERSLLALGAEVEEHEHPLAARLPVAEALGLEAERGRVLAPRQWYRGFRALLQRCARELAESTPELVLNDPGAIATHFDKAACHRVLVEAGVQVAPALPPVSSYDELRAAMHQAGWSRVFLKLKAGSSASGVVALQASQRRIQAETSAEMVHVGGELRLYNSLRVRRYRDEAEVAALVNALAAEGVHAERWIPKATQAGQAFDLRVVVIGGRARQCVVRRSPSPMTNLHLGGSRGDLTAVQARLGSHAWAALTDLAQRALAPFPSLYAGVDLMVGSAWKRTKVVEVNAFGDLLPRVTHEGAGCYEAQVCEALRLLERQASSEEV